MHKKLTHKDVHLLQSWARTFLVNTPLPATLPGMVNRDIDESELLAISYLQASLQLLNSMGLLVPDWDKKFEIEFQHQDCEPMAEYHDYDDAEDPAK